MSNQVIGDGGQIPFNQSGKLEVEVSDQTTRPLDLWFVTQTGQGAPTTIAVETAIDDQSITVADATNFPDGQYFGIFGGDPDVPQFYFGTVVGTPVGNVIQVDSLLDSAFLVGASVLPFNRSLNVDGSTTPVVFSIRAGGPTATFSIDITRVVGIIETGTPVDLKDFGDLDPLPRGLLLRRRDGLVENYWTVKRNAGFIPLCGPSDVVPYIASNPGQGVDGLGFRYTLSGQDKHGVAIRLTGSETLELIVQDDLTDLVDFGVVAAGHFVGD
jgi:hypothetical protein